jgi:hypothetical protein
MAGKAVAAREPLFLSVRNQAYSVKYLDCMSVEFYFPINLLSSLSREGFLFYANPIILLLRVKSVIKIYQVSRECRSKEI